MSGGERTRNMQESSILLGPMGPAADIPSAEAHFLRSMIELKWTMAEQEIGRIKRRLAGEPWRGDSKSWIDHDSKALVKLAKKKGDPEEHKSAVKIRELVCKSRLLRNSLVHGRILMSARGTTFHVKDSSKNQASGSMPIGTGPLIMRHESTMVEFTEEGLRPIHRDVEALLQAIYEMLILCEMDYMHFSGTISLEGSKNPDLHFGEGRRTVDVSKTIRARDIQKLNPLKQYECQVCGEISPLPEQTAACHGQPPIQMEPEFCHQCRTQLSPRRRCEHLRFRHKAIHGPEGSS